jgi:hypothetical protein
MNVTARKGAWDNNDQAQRADTEALLGSTAMPKGRVRV